MKYFRTVLLAVAPLGWVTAQHIDVGPTMNAIPSVHNHDNYNGFYEAHGQHHDHATQHEAVHFDAYLGNPASYATVIGGVEYRCVDEEVIDTDKQKEYNKAVHEEVVKQQSELGRNLDPDELQAIYSRLQKETGYITVATDCAEVTVIEVAEPVVAPKETTAAAVAQKEVQTQTNSSETEPQQDEETQVPSEQQEELVTDEAQILSEEKNAPVEPTTVWHERVWKEILSWFGW